MLKFGQRGEERGERTDFPLRFLPSTPSNADKVVAADAVANRH